MEPLAVDKREAGRLMGISPYTVADYIRKGKLGARRIGRRIVIPMECIRSFLNSAPEVVERDGK
jgi:excisionase family DNA binding protein